MSGVTSTCGIYLRLPQRRRPATKKLFKNHANNGWNSSVSIVSHKTWSTFSSLFHVGHRHSCSYSPRAANSYDRNLDGYLPSSKSNTGADIVEKKVAVLVIGGGGREGNMHFVMPCSSLHPVTQSFVPLIMLELLDPGDATCISDLNISDSSAVVAFCRKWEIELVVVGPDAPLVSGLANDLVKAGIPTFGPSAEAAALEGSKDFMKKL